MRLVFNQTTVQIGKVNANKIFHGSVLTIVTADGKRDFEDLK